MYSSEMCFLVIGSKYSKLDNLKSRNILTFDGQKFH